MRRSDCLCSMGVCRPTLGLRQAVLCTVVAVTLHATAFPPSVRAAPFERQSCPTCPNATFVKYTYDSSDPNEVRPNPYAGVQSTWPDAWDYPEGVGPGDHYGSAIRDYSHFIHANGYVEEIKLVFDYFDLVDDQDYLSIWSGFEMGEYSGHQPSSPPFVHTAHRQTILGQVRGFNKFWVRLRLNTLGPYERGFTGGGYPPQTDAKNYVTDDGFNISLATVCCGALADDLNPGLLEDTERHQLMLLGAGDFLTFKYDNDLAGTGSIVAIWANDIDGFARYDIYARCNAPPTHDVYDYSTVDDPQTFRQALLLRSNKCTIPGTWYITVHQETGDVSGTMNLVVTRHFNTERHHVDVGFDFSPTSIEKAKATATVPTAARLFYGASEGSQVIKSIRFHDTTSCNDCAGEVCDVCWSDSPLRSFAEGGCQGRVTIRTGCWESPGCVAHEWGHAFMCLADEYCDGCYGFAPLLYCSHGMMGGYYATNNFCIDDDHQRDTFPVAPNYPLPPGGGVWPQASSPVVINNTTPDPYDYFGHPLGKEVARVVSGRSGRGSSCRAVIAPFPRIGHLMVWLFALGLCAVQRRRMPGARRRRCVSVPSSVGATGKETT